VETLCRKKGEANGKMDLDAGGYENSDLGKPASDRKYLKKKEKNVEDTKGSPNFSFDKEYNNKKKPSPREPDQDPQRMTDEMFMKKRKLEGFQKKPVYIDSIQPSPESENFNMKSGQVGPGLKSEKQKRLEEKLRRHDENLKKRETEKNQRLKQADERRKQEKREKIQRTEERRRKLLEEQETVKRLQAEDKERQKMLEEEKSRLAKLDTEKWKLGSADGSCDGSEKARNEVSRPDPFLVDGKSKISGGKPGFVISEKIIGTPLKIIMKNDVDIGGRARTKSPMMVVDRKR
jgi:hypothetical protein